MLQEIQTRVLEQVDWRPTKSDDFLLLLTRMINRAYQVLFNDMPFLLEQEVHFVTQPDVVSATAVTQDRVLVEPTDRRVMTRLHTGLPTTAAVWVFDRTWDGREVELVGADGVVRRRKTREWWQTVNAPPPASDGLTYDHFSIEEPWKNNTDTGMVYRVYTPEYHLPADVVEVKSARLWTDSNHLLRVTQQGEMEMGQLLDYRGRTQGLPEILYRGKPFQLQAPTMKPNVRLLSSDLSGTSPWIGPDNAGEFDVCFTYGWGAVDADYLTPASGLPELRWESAASPISDRISTTNDGAALSVKLPDVDFELNFNISGLPSATHSGMWKRIYLRRYSVDQGGGITRTLEAPGVFMLLAEVDGYVQDYKIDGSVLADYLRRLKQINGYQSVRIYPNADTRYEIDCRVQYRPGALVNNFDAPRLAEDGIDALVQKALVFFLDFDGKPELSQKAEVAYQNMLRTLTKRYGNLDYGLLHKKAARVRRSPVGMRSRSVTYHDPT